VKDAAEIADQFIGVCCSEATSGEFENFSKKDRPEA
jgi:hypothetical protein